MSSTKLSDTRLQYYWNQFQSNKQNNFYRNALIEHYSAIAKNTAYRALKYRPNEDLDDLTAITSSALIRSVDKFDPSRGFKFETFAIDSMKNAVYTYLRDQDWIPRRDRDKIRVINNFIAEYNEINGFTPSDVECSSATEIPEGDIIQLKDVCRHQYIISLDEKNEDGFDLSDTLFGESHIEIENVVKGYETEVLNQACSNLPENWTFVVKEYFYNNKRVSDIAQELSLSSSRITAMLNSAVRKMRKDLMENKEFMMTLAE